MKKLVSVIAGLVALSAAFAIPAFAQVPTGQFEGGNFYRAANVNNGGEFTDPTTATCNDIVQFRARIHNIGAFPAENVRVAATLPTAAGTSHSSMATLSSSNSNTVTDTAGVNLDKSGTLAYIAGSTELLDANQAKLSNLPDGIVSGGVTLPDPVGVSVDQKRSVQFKVKVNCPTPPPANIQVCELATKRIITIREDQFNPNLHTRDLSKCADQPGDINVCEIATKRIITIKENEFDSSKHTRDLSKCQNQPVVVPNELPNTGAGALLGLFASVAAAGTLAYRFVWTRFNV